MDEARKASSTAPAHKRPSVNGTGWGTTSPQANGSKASALSPLATHRTAWQPLGYTGTHSQDVPVKPGHVQAPLEIKCAPSVAKYTAVVPTSLFKPSCQKDAG